MPRCAWCGTDPLYIDYHDREWGVPARDPQVLFEFLLLEAFQAGLSWITVLRKRERYRQVLFGFDAERLARMSDAEIEEWAGCKEQVDRHFIREGTYLGEADLVSAINRLRTPTLYLAPRRGEMAPDPSEVANPLVRLVLLDGVGHCVRRDAPEAYYGLVDPFIEEVFAGTGR